MSDDATYGEDALKDADIKSGEEAGKRPAEGSTGDTGDGTGEGDAGQASDGVPAEGRRLPSRRAGRSAATPGGATR